MENSINIVRMEASAKDGEGAGRGPCGLRNSELGPLLHDVLFHLRGSVNPFRFIFGPKVPFLRVYIMEVLF